MTKNVFAGNLIFIDQRGMQAQFVKTNWNPKIKEKKQRLKKLAFLHESVKKSIQKWHLWTFMSRHRSL